MNIMIDIETLSTVPFSHILSIGACVTGYEADCTFYNVPSPIQNRHIDPKTVTFWMSQGAELFPPQTVDNPPLRECLLNLNAWIRIMCIKFGVGYQGDDCVIWCKGTDFDVAILKDAYESLGVEIPWKYNAVRDLRTLIKVFPGIVKPVNPNPHNALEDAKSQSQHLQVILKFIGIVNEPI
jgi:hypothetical protein